MYALIEDLIQSRCFIKIDLSRLDAKTVQKIEKKIDPNE